MKNKSRIFYTIISIFLGLLFGSIILLINGINPLEAYKVIFFGSIGKPAYISWTLVNATPIILTGVSVAFAFKTGLFNIGAEGQFIVGSIGAVIIGVVFKLPPIIHPIVALFGGFLCGAVWGALSGYLKSRFEVNEVISSIMLNWVAFYLSNYLVGLEFLKLPASSSSYPIYKTANIEFLSSWKKSEIGVEFLKQHKYIKQFLRPPISWGIIIAIIVAILIWYILKKTTLGYQLKAVGFNKYAAEYGGIDIKQKQVISMTIAGALSGLAGAITVLSVSHNISLMSAPQGYGFSGMAVSLIAGNNPLACIPAGLLFAGLNYGGGKLNSALNTHSEVVSIVIGIIIFFIAMPKLLDLILSKLKIGGGKNE